MILVKNSVTKYRPILNPLLTNEYPVNEENSKFQFTPVDTPWAVGHCCISLKVPKSPHKEIYSFKLTMLWLFLSSSLSSAEYFHLCSMHTTTVAMWAPAPPNPFSFSLLGTSQNNQNLISRHSVESMQYGAGAH